MLRRLQFLMLHGNVMHYKLLFFAHSLSISLLDVHAASMNSMTLRPDEQTQEEVVDSCDETWTAESGGGRRDFSLP